MLYLHYQLTGTFSSNLLAERLFGFLYIVELRTDNLSNMQGDFHYDGDGFVLAVLAWDHCRNCSTSFCCKSSVPILLSF